MIKILHVPIVFLQYLFCLLEMGIGLFLTNFEQILRLFISSVVSCKNGFLGIGLNDLLRRSWLVVMTI